MSSIIGNTDKNSVGQPGVFLDRDGVINRATVRGSTPYPPQTLDEVVVLPGVADALGRLRDAGLPILVVTNQPDVARGTQTREVVEQINASLRASLPMIDAVYTCCHDTPDNCECRKPRPGMLQQGARKHGIDLTKSYMVGDRWSDIAAGQAVGCTTLLIDQPYSQADRCTPDYKVADLSQAVEIIVRRQKEQQEPV